MDEKVQTVPMLGEIGEDAVDRLAVGHVAGQDDLRADLFGQRHHPAAERFALIGEGKLRALLAAGLRDSPGDRFVVGQTHDQPAFAFHQPLRHPRLLAIE